MSRFYKIVKTFKYDLDFDFVRCLYTPRLVVEDPETNKKIILNLYKNAWNSVEINLVAEKDTGSTLKFKIYLINSKNEVVVKDVFSLVNNKYTSNDLNNYLTKNVKKFMEGNEYKVIIEHIVPQKSEDNGESAEVTIEKLKIDIENLKQEHKLQQKELRQTFENLKKDFGHLFSSSHCSDLRIKTSDKVQLKAHKLILRSRSEYFDSMFSHNMKEKMTSEIVMDFDSCVVKRLFRYIYTGEISMKDANSLQLFEAATYYQIKNLPEICVKSIQKYLSPENALDTIPYSIIYELDDLFDSCAEHLKSFLPGLSEDQQFIKFPIEMRCKILEKMAMMNALKQT